MTVLSTALRPGAPEAMTSACRDRHLLLLRLTPEHDQTALGEESKIPLPEAHMVNDVELHRNSCPEKQSNMKVHCLAE